MDEPEIGGMVVTQCSYRGLPDSELGLFLMSDLHVGAANCDKRLIRRELLAAQSRSDRILINGDIFEAIGPGDRRYEPGRVSAAVRGQTEWVNAAVQEAYELLQPYAHMIDMLGTGNHEAGLARRTGCDMVRMLAERLGVSYGGYSGFMAYKVQLGRRAHRYLIYYHHGEGKGSGGSAGLNTLMGRTWIDADCYWQGHLHAKAVSTEHRLRLSKRGRVETHEVTMVQSGSYYRIYGSGQSPQDVLRVGRKADYASQIGCRPGGMGGVRLTLTEHDGHLQVRATQ